MTNTVYVDLLGPLCVVTMPIYGLFCGIDFTIYMSLLLYAYVICSEFGQLTSDLSRVMSFRNARSLGLLCLCLLTGFVYLTLYPLVWLYEKFLLISELGFQASEMFLIFNFALHTNKRTRETVREGESVISELVLDCVTTLCYAVMVLFGVAIYVEGRPLHQWLLFLVLVLSVAVHVMMLTSQEGILCDAAFSCVCSVAALYAMTNETMIRPPQSNAAQKYLTMLQGPFFWITVAIRYCVILYITKTITGKNLFDQVDSRTSTRKMSHQRFILISKLVVIFMFTQMSANLIYATGGIPCTRLYRPEFLRKFCPRDIVLGRILQIIIVHFCYIWRLYKPLEWMRTIDVFFRQRRAIDIFNN